jgi:hypothetical protein
MTARIDEVATDLYRISLYVPQFDLQFNHFVIRDEEPLLFHTGMRGMSRRSGRRSRHSSIRRASGGSVGVTSRSTNVAPSTNGCQSRQRRCRFAGNLAP